MSWSWSEIALVLDVSFLAHRAWHAVERDTMKGGTPKMVPAFAASIVKILREQSPRYLIAVAESDAPTWRHELFPAYKKDRAPHPPGFEEAVIEALRFLGLHKIPVHSHAGFEGDDTIAAIVRQLRARGVGTVILTADKDLRQLVADAAPMVVLWNGRDVGDRKSWVGEGTVRDEWGIGPDRVADLLALAGDDTDGIPGLPKIGKKHAAAMIEGTRDMEHLISIRMWGDSAVSRSLRDHTDEARLYRRLAALRDDVPVELDLDAAEVLPERWDIAGLLELFETHGMGWAARDLAGG